jgi:hypothetical protein
MAESVKGISEQAGPEDIARGPSGEGPTLSGAVEANGTLVVD